ncbi:MAG: type III pantothenate kinase [Abitibacteriaceae bacterium]|nr:type III pantothenate kinase [Abditibacteriaceae bacterium]
MLLAFNIGNTTISVGVFNGPDLAAQWRLSTHHERTADELAAFLKVAFDAHGYRFKDIDGVAISSVVPPLTLQASLLSNQYFHITPVVVGPKLDIGLVNDYENPHEVGADRLVNGLAAWKKFKTAVVVVDSGTATTVDVVTKDGHFLGGAIAPGLRISTEALFMAAARLPRVEVAMPEQAIGRNTVAAMQSGIFFGYAGLVKELITRCTQELKSQGSNDPVTVVATGGLAEMIAPLVSTIQHVEPQLTLDGLRLIWDHATSEPSTTIETQ